MARDETDVQSLNGWKNLFISARSFLNNEDRVKDEPPGASLGGRQDSNLDVTALVAGELPQTLLQNSNIGDVLACASEIERISPMVARILADYAYQLVSQVDPTSEGRGVLQFKTYLYTILKSRREDRDQSSNKEEDILALQNFYRDYLDIVQQLEGTDKIEELAKAYKNAQIIGFVLKELSKTIAVKVSPQITHEIKEIEEKTQVFSLQKYNIVPVDIPNSTEPIMELEEVKVAMKALRNVSGLPRKENGEAFSDILEFLEFMFGFQNDNVRNQRENIVLLIASQYSNFYRSPSDPMTKAIEEIYQKTLKNFHLWENYIIPHNKMIPLPDSPTKQLIYFSLYLLIWGEAANVRFLPECLCFIFHKMATEMVRSLSNPIAVKYLYNNEDTGNRYLDRVIQPLYKILSAEAEYGGHGEKSKGHEEWRNYDDLNEYFWLNQCLDLSWPFTSTDSFFFPPIQPKKQSDDSSSFSTDRDRTAIAKTKKQSKTNFVEWRTFFHLFRSFHRVWIFLFAMFQALCIIGFGGSASEMLTIFPTIAILNFIKAFLDILMSWNSFKTMGKSNLSRKFARLFLSGAWTAFLLYIVIAALQSDDTSLKKVTVAFAYAMVAIYLLPNFIISFFLSLSFIRKRTDRISYWKISRFVKWFYKDELFVGRGLYESTKYFFMYVSFWLILLGCKFTFSYYLQIKPLIDPTRKIINSDSVEYQWHSFISKNHSNVSSIIALWAPVVVIYLLDIQIWYTVLSAIGGGIIGAKWHLGEIRSLGMMRARFRSFPSKFSLNFKSTQVVNANRDPARESGDRLNPDNFIPLKDSNAQRFAFVWNEIIHALREEDYLSNKEVHSLLMPPNDRKSSFIQWPLFLLANQIYLAIATALDKKEFNDGELWKLLCENENMRCSVVEVYHLIKSVLLEILRNEENETIEQWIVDSIYVEMENCLKENFFVTKFRLKSLNQLHSKLSDLTSILVQKQDDSKTAKAVSALQSLWEVTKREFISEELKNKFENTFKSQRNANLHPFSAISWPSNQYNVKRLHSLLTMKESSVEIPKNLEARRRLEFFTNSLFMDMPDPPSVATMVPLCVMTPYYAEIVTYSKDELSKENEDGISTLFYLQKIFPDEWQNFLERIGCKQRELEQKMKKEGEDLTELRLWTSYRGQTLTRTVRGMMYYRRALCLLAYLENENLNEEDLEMGFQNYDIDRPESNKLFYINKQTRAMVDLKFTYVVTCQIYGQQKLKKDSRASDIFSLMKNHEALRVAYIDEVEVNEFQGENKKTKKEYYSCLIRVDNFGQEQEIYRIKLPGQAKIGEGKPENQNHAIVFSRGEALQTIDMNQDNYLEEALKIRNLLQEFRSDGDIRKPTILGVREHVFTGSVSSLAWFMSNQETSFVTLGQRFLAYPLKVRMHYGHPDVFDRLFHITRGGISKASKTINISEDIYAGFNTTLRQGNVTHHEYIQVGKGRDVGLNQIALFEAKVSSGNGEQTLSRDIYRLGQQFDFFRMMSFFYTTVGFYTCTFLTVVCVYFFLYGRLYLALSGVEDSLNDLGILSNNIALESALNVQFLIQTGIFTAVPMIIGSILEKGLLTAIISFFTMQLQLASVFFTFSLGTRTHYFGRTILHGGAKYRSTGRGFVVHHEKFSEIYRLFSRSHFVKGLEVAMLLTFYMVYGASSNSTTYLLLTISSWFLSFSWCFAPFVFNPSGFEWQKTVSDFDDWTNWLFYHGGVGVKGEMSWEAWWEEEQSHIRTLRSRILEIILSLRFFIFQFGVVYHLNITNGDTSLLPYGLSWGVLFLIIAIFWMGNRGRTWDAQLPIRMLQSFLFLGSCGVLVFCFLYFDNLTVGDICAGLLSFIPTGWGLLQICIAIKPLLVFVGLWKNVCSLARLYDALMGALLFLPLAILSWFPFVSTFQTRLVFNQAFSRGLEISLILAGNKKD